MNILLDAYFDHNFGDDVFIQLLLQRYREHCFFAFLKGCPEDVQSWARTFPNLIVLPHTEQLLASGMFDAYIMIGGDVIPDGGDYTGSYERRIGYMKAVRKNGGYVGMLGFSLYDRYSEKTLGDIRTMVTLSDDVAVRDTASFRLLRSLFPEEKKIRLAGDMAFLWRFGTGGDKSRERADSAPVLGLSIREKLGITKDVYEGYIHAMAGIIRQYLTGVPDARVRFLSLSYGSAKDTECARKIQELLSEAEIERTEIFSYTGDVRAYFEGMEQCDAFITTRFHSLVAALLSGRPFVPVVYEVKVSHLLEEIGYHGPRLPYGPVDPADTETVFEGFKKLSCDQDAHAAYRKRCGSLFMMADRYLKG